MQNFEERLRTCVRQEGRHLSDIIFRNWVINVSNQNCIYCRLFWCWHNFFILKINKVTIIWKTCVLFAPSCILSHCLNISFHRQVVQATPWLPLLPILSHWHKINHTRHKNLLHNDKVISEYCGNKWYLSGRNDENHGKLSVQSASQPYILTANLPNTILRCNRLNRRIRWDSQTAGRHIKHKLALYWNESSQCILWCILSLLQILCYKVIISYGCVLYLSISQIFFYVPKLFA